MKKILLALFFLSLALPVGWASSDEGGGVKGVTKSVVSGIVSTGKDAMSGISEGIDEGRRQGESLDRARLVATKAEFQSLLSISVFKSEDLGDDVFRLTLAIKNDNEFPVRVTNLFEPANVVLLDKDGFSVPLMDPIQQGHDITALPRSMTRATFTFGGVESEPDVFRLFDSDAPVPPSVKAPATTSSGEPDPAKEPENG